MSNFSLFHVIAHDDQTDAIKGRKVAVASQQRLDSRYGHFLASDIDSFDARWAYIEDEALGVVAATIEEFDADLDAPTILKSYRSSRAPKTQERTASVVHEARKPRMCPFHKDVTDISLAAGDPRAGFDSMAQHWGGPRHCEGDGYKGESCKFKPEMTTQSYWDERSEKLQQQRDEKAQREQEQAEQAELEAIEQPEEVEVPETVEQELESPPAEEFAEETVEAPVAELELSENAQELVHAKTADTGLGGPVPKMDKRPWTPRGFDQPIPVDDPEGRNPTRHQDILEPVKPQNADRRNPGKLKDIGEQNTEHQDVEKAYKGPNRSDQGGTFSHFASADEVAEAIRRHKS